MVVSLDGCDLNAVKDEKALAQVGSIGVCLIASTFVRLDGNILGGTSLTAKSTTPYMVLLGDHVEALDKAIMSNSRDGLSFVRIESITEGVSSLTANSLEEFAKQKIDEEDKYSNYETRRNMSPSLASRYSKDAILWIYVQFDTAKKPAPHYYEGPLSPGVSWRIELYGRDGRQLFADSFSSRAEDTVGSFEETETERSIVIYPSSYVEANRRLAVQLSRDGMGSLTESIVKARSAK